MRYREAPVSPVLERTQTRYSNLENIGAAQ